MRRVGDVVERLRAVEPVELTDGRLRRFVWVRPEFDCWDACAHGDPRCRRDSGGWHGIGSRRLVWGVALEGDGGVACDLHTPIYAESALARDPARLDLGRWVALGAVDVHLARPVRTEHGEWGTRIDECEVTGGPCWVDGTMLQAELGLETFLRGGNEAVWTWLGEAWLPRVVELLR